MTPARWWLLDHIHLDGAFLKGPQVRMARAMPEFVTLEDRDGRWWAVLTPKAIEALKHQCFSCIHRPQKYTTGLCEPCHRVANRPLPKKM